MSIQAPAQERLLIALADLVDQADIREYRNARGRLTQDNLSLASAQALADEFGLTHEQICRALETCDGDLGRAAAQLLAATT